jgi:uncharacterized protein
MLFGLHKGMLPPMPRPKWWSGGVRFECQGSGKCCASRGQYGFVYLTLEDRRRMAKVLGLTLREFSRLHCAKTDGYWHLKDDTATPDCRFLDGTKCDVYEGRPTQCRTWPFWPEVMGAKGWAREVAAFCPGVGKGPLISPEKIREKVREQTESERQMEREAKSS